LKYIHADKNIGFGRGHNKAVKFIKKADIHLVLNPDINFEPTALEEFLEWFIEEKDVVLAIPKVLYPDGSFQHVVRDIPTPITLFKRKLNNFSDEWSEDRLQDITEIPFAHGCFFAFDYNVYRQLNGFEEKYFMYMEDIDIWIRAKKYGKTLYNPYYKIYHEHRKGSSKSLKLFIYHLVSAIKFFRKYSL
jgi:GT2 family glycosyltransferase